MNQQSEPPVGEAKNRPVHQVRFGNVRAAIWSKQTERGRMFSVTTSRSYTTKTADGVEEWHDSESFGRDDLLVLAKALDECHSWIHAQKS